MVFVELCFWDRLDLSNNIAKYVTMLFELFSLVRQYLCILIHQPVRSFDYMKCGAYFSELLANFHITMNLTFLCAAVFSGGKCNGRLAITFQGYSVVMTNGKVLKWKDTFPEFDYALRRDGI